MAGDIVTPRHDGTIAPQCDGVAITDAAILGFQDTLFANGGRARIARSLIAGNIDILPDANLRPQSDAQLVITRADGSPQSEPLAEGLVTRDRRTVYRVDDGIPVLLADEALATSAIAGFPR